MPFPIAAALLGAGMVAQGTGNFLGAQSQNRAQRRAGDEQREYFYEGMGRFGIPYLGLGGYEDANTAGGMWYTDPVTGQVRPATREERTAAAGRLSNSIGGPIIGQQRGIADFIGQGQAAILGQYDADTSRLADYSGGVTSSILGDIGRRSSNIAGRLGGDINRTMALSRGAEGIASRFGRGAETLIDEDAARALKNANALSGASLASSGLGVSSLGANFAATNAREVGRGAARDKLGVRQATTDRLLGARAQSAGLSGQMAGLRSGTLTDLLGIRSGAAERLGSAQVGREYGRASDRTNQQYANLSREAGAKQATIDLLNSYFASPINNPYLGYSPPVPGAGSPFGAALMEGGNAMAGLGAWGVGQQSQLDLIQQQLAMQQQQRPGPGSGGTISPFFGGRR